MSPFKALTGLTGTGFPRVSGDEPVTVGSDSLTRMFSPRERG